ncbi:GNAT family N-acetyltransferase [Caulobacter segnis]|uniref:GNAT family N-acetyltransferase n=1 Tax=Caulobacter segnis TaxID=88688 RepID=UPI001CBD3C32|nr:GNAT family N-acetyltransferase [Caulobacter segnis]
MPKHDTDTDTLARDLTVVARTQGGLDVRMRPATSADHDALAAFFADLSPEDRRHRFLASLKTVDERQLALMIRNDDGPDRTFVSCDAADGAILAVATLATGLDAERAEVAVSVRSDLKGRGLSWSLLKHALTYARAVGVKVVESIETADNHPALDLEREMGFTVRPVSDDHGLRLAERAV